MKGHCTLTGQEFTISDFEVEFCQRERLPLPILAPQERLRELLSFRNRINLFHTLCAGTGKRILTGFHPSRGFNVVDVDYWESDGYDPRSTALNYDPNRPFFEQLTSLLQRAALPNLAVIKSGMENSDYTNGTTGAKNCYLVFGLSRCEDCQYSRSLVDCRNLIDCVFAVQCELCFDCRSIISCYELKYSDECNQCSTSAFLANCQSCSDCFMCVNLTNKRYCFKNQQLSRSEYLNVIAQWDLGDYAQVSQLKGEFGEYVKQFPVKCFAGRNNERSSGHFINHTKNTHNSYFVGHSEDLDHAVWVNRAKSSAFYCMYGEGAELIYNTVTAGDNAYNIKFSAECWRDVSDLEYCIFTCHGSSNCFGCIGLKHASYCVLNQQYSKDDYFRLVDTIKNRMRENGEYGRFFPQSMSLYHYNLSEADTYLPLPRETALNAGFLWSDDREVTDNTRPITPLAHINDVTESIIDQELVCERTGKKFRVNKPELDFYRRLHIPPPRIHPIERIRMNSDFLEILPLNSAHCAECQNDIITPYNVDQQRVLCEGCFQQARI